MTAKTRKFVWGSSAVIVGGLCTGLVAYFGGLPTGAFSRQVGPNELALVPADAAVVAYADVGEVMNSDLRQKLLAVMPREEKGREDFKAKTGIDIEQDIDYVLACVLPASGRESGFVVLRGRFDEVKLESLAREHNATLTDYKGTRVFRLHEADDEAAGRHHGMTPALAFVEAGTMMVGDEAAIHRALDTRAAGQGVTGNSEVMDLIKDLDGGANAWAVGRFDALASRAQLPDGVKNQLPQVKWFAAAGHINGGMTGVLRAEATDDKAAQNLRDVVNGFLALARMQSGSRPELQTLMQSVTLGGTGTTVELSFTVPSEVLDLIPRLGHTGRDGALD